MKSIPHIMLDINEVCPHIRLDVDEVWTLVKLWAILIQQGNVFFSVMFASSFFIHYRVTFLHTSAYTAVPVETEKHHQYWYIWQHYLTSYMLAPPGFLHWWKFLLLFFFKFCNEYLQSIHSDLQKSVCLHLDTDCFIKVSREASEQTQLLILNHLLTLYAVILGRWKGNLNDLCIN